MSITLTVESDLSKVIQAFQNFSEEFGDELEGVTEDIATELLLSAEENCPSPTSLKYPTNSTGFLRDSHSVETDRLGDSFFVIRVTNSADYASYVHEGHQTVAARPWLQETLAEKESGIIAMINDKIESFINRIFV